MSTSADTDDVIPGVPRPRRTLKPGPRPWLQPGLVVGAGLPAVFFAVEAIRGKLGANPIAETLNAFGLCALVLLVLSLACTPVRVLTGVAWIQPLRRTFGLLGFGYAALHLLLYAVVDQQLAWKVILFGGVLTCGIGIRYYIRKSYEAWPRIWGGKPQPDDEAIVRRAMWRGTYVLWTLWAQLAVIGWLGVAKPL